MQPSRAWVEQAALSPTSASFTGSIKNYSDDRTWQGTQPADFQEEKGENRKKKGQNKVIFVKKIQLENLEGNRIRDSSLYSFIENKACQTNLIALFVL